MSQENCNVEQAISCQTQRELLDYWTPERMQNAKPLMLKVPDDPISVPQSPVEEPSEPSISAPGSDANNKQAALLTTVICQVLFATEPDKLPYGNS